MIMMTMTAIKITKMMLMIMMMEIMMMMMMMKMVMMMSLIIEKLGIRTKKKRVTTTSLVLSDKYIDTSGTEKTC